MSDCNNNCAACGEDCPSRNAPQFFLKEHHPDAVVRRVFGVVSGKGGVGKSMVTCQLAVTLNRMGYRVGIMDADVTGPSIPQAFGLHEKAYGTADALLPCLSETGIQVISMNVLLDDETDPVIWRGPVIGGVVQQFWTDVIWDVDFLLVDMPPGTGDVTLNVFQQIPLNGIVVVTSPQELVSMIVEKAVNMAGMMKVPILGMVENMAYMICPHCGERLSPFGKSRLEETAAAFGIRATAQMPIDPELAALCDGGRLEEYGQEPLKALFRQIEEKLG